MGDDGRVVVGVLFHVPRVGVLQHHQSACTERRRVRREKEREIKIDNAMLLGD